MEDVVVLVALVAVQALFVTMLLFVAPRAANIRASLQYKYDFIITLTAFK